jgi:hypothetical protein
MSLGKSPGSDGLSVAFFRKILHLLAKPYIAMMKVCTDRGSLSNSQKECVIRLIEKRGKMRDTLKSFRPISLMNVDAKLYSKCITNRLKNCVSKCFGQ